MSIPERFIPIEVNPGVWQIYQLERDHGLHEYMYRMYDAPNTIYWFETRDACEARIEELNDLMDL